MSGGEIAGLIAAIAFVLLVGLLALPILKLTRTLEEARRSIARLTDETVPTLRGTAEAVTEVNGRLVTVGGITRDVNDMTSNVSGLTALATTTLGGPMVRMSAFSYGVRRAIGHRREAAAVERTRQAERADRRARRRARRDPARQSGAANQGGATRQGGADQGGGAR